MMLGQFFNKKAQLKANYRKFIWMLMIAYGCFIGMICFMPQPSIDGVTTPNVIYLGRLRLLLVPFNSFIYFNELDSLWEKFWVVGQNIANVFLLYPLGICIHILWDRWSGLKKSLLLGFSMSAFIEVTQLLLDLLFEFNRVFEIDDLWTNALGVFLSYLTVKWLKNKQLLNKHNMN